MTERQKLIAHKIAVQRTKNTLKRLDGVDVLEIYTENENQGLNALYAAYSATYETGWEPCSRLPWQSPDGKIWSWLIDTLGLREKEYFLLCGFWCRIRIWDLRRAAASLWRKEENVVGFLLAETDLSRVVECGFDSRDEDHYLCDIWEAGRP